MENSFNCNSRKGKKIEQLTLVERFDSNKNGIVDRSEARYALATGSAGPAFNLNAGRKSKVVPKVFNILDTDKNGSLSKKEMSLASKQLKSRDADNNDLLDIGELGGNIANQNRFVIVSGGGFGGGGNRSTTAHLLGEAADLDSLYKSMTKEYGDKTGNITKIAFQLVLELFTRLDRNRNGQIDKEEMKGFQNAPPHLVFLSNFSRKDKKDRSTIEFLSKDSTFKNAKVRHVGKNELLVDLKVVKLKFSVSNAASNSGIDRIAKMMMQSYDKNNNGYIEKKEIPKGNTNAMNQFLNWDADSNGMVYPKEIEKGFEEQFATNSSRITARVRNYQPSLFSVLDLSGDGVVGLREIQNATNQLRKIDQDGNGKFDSSELPGEISVKFSRGQQGPMMIGNSIFALGGLGNRFKTRTTKKTGPKWFREMDRNGDGDISPKEFLGEMEQFRSIDSNKDGFIEAKEATEFDKKRRK